jgi:hypothetical protein
MGVKLFSFVHEQNVGCREVVVHTLGFARANERAPHWLDSDTHVQSVLICELEEPRGPP